MGNQHSQEGEPPATSKPAKKSRRASRQERASSSSASPAVKTAKSRLRVVEIRRLFQSNGIGVVRVQFDRRLTNKLRADASWWGLFECSDELIDSSDWRLPWAYLSPAQLHSCAVDIAVPGHFLLSPAAARFTVRLLVNQTGPEFELAAESRVLRADEFLDVDVDAPTIHAALQPGPVLAVTLEAPFVKYTGVDIPQNASSSHCHYYVDVRAAAADEGHCARTAIDPHGTVALRPAEHLRPGVNAVELVAVYQHYNTVLSRLHVRLSNAATQLQLVERAVPSLFQLALHVVSERVVPHLVTDTDGVLVRPQFAGYAGPVFNRLAQQCSGKLPAQRFVQLFAGTQITELTLPGHRFDATALAWLQSLPQLQQLSFVEVSPAHLLADALPPLPALLGLSLQQVWAEVTITAATWQELERKLPNLRRLSLSAAISDVFYPRVHYDDAAARLFARLGAFELTQFKSGDGANFWHRLLRSAANAQLTSLAANASPDFDDTAVQLLLDSCPNLVRLACNYSRVSHAALPLLQRLPRLTSLAMSHARGLAVRRIDAACTDALHALAGRLSSLHAVSPYHGTLQLRRLELDAQADGRDVALCAVVWKLQRGDDNTCTVICERICPSTVAVGGDWVGYYASESAGKKDYKEWNYLRDVVTSNDPDLGPRQTTRTFRNVTSKGVIRYFCGSYHLLGVCSLSAFNDQ